ncbi:MAG: hypothetical protein Q4A27_01350 [bacterium]|nr:hypothetical protein [bacterium]MDO4872060.1 hypothetical protein [bacterium]
MKTKNKKNNKTKIIIISAAVLIVAIFSGAYFFFWNNHQSTENKISSSNEQKTENSTKEEKTEKPAENSPSQTKTTQTNSDKPNAPTLDQSVNKYRVGISTSVDQDNTNEIVIRGLISLSIESGNCDVILTSPSGNTQTKKTEILMSPTTSSCKTLSLPKNSLEKGLWKYKIKYETSEIIGESNENTFEIK